MPTLICSKVLALHKITWKHGTGAGLEPPNCLWYLQAHLSLGRGRWQDMAHLCSRNIAGPFRFPGTCHPLHGTGRRAGLKGDLTAGGEMQRSLFCVCYSNLRSKTMNWWQKLLPSGIILSWCRMDSSSLYDNRCQWAGIWCLLHRWNIFLQAPVLGSLFTVCMVSIL